MLTGKHRRTSTASTQSGTSTKRARIGSADSGIVDDSARKKARRGDQLPIAYANYELRHRIQGFAHEGIQHKHYLEQQNVKSSKKSRKGRKDEEDDQEDEHLDLWSCAYDPLGASVAVCGANSVLLLDARHGRYTMKYTHPEDQEEFYTLAWTRVSAPQGHVNVLAAAGRLGSVKLIDPLQQYCYRYLMGHSQPVLHMTFAKNDPNWLVTASADGYARLWDIGTPSNELEDSKCLAIFNCRQGKYPTSVALSADASELVVGTHQGEVLHFHLPKSKLTQWRRRATAKAAGKGDDANDKTGMHALEPKQVHPRGKAWHNGHIDGVHYIYGDDTENSHEFDGCIVSRGANDEKFTIWDPSTSKKAAPDVRRVLDYSGTNQSSGLRFTLIEQQGQKMLLSGDDQGDLRVYDLTAPKTGKGRQPAQKSKKVLWHNDSVHLIRDVCVSPDTATLVAVDSNNTVFVWAASA
ncbi:WD40-repeat-containing domain protein [Gongronella butleri]|nr:WD40-repeat-containing domain protein [Gongronella butleri]